jgi:sulfonate transport system permease protein
MTMSKQVFGARHPTPDVFDGLRSTARKAPHLGLGRPIPYGSAIGPALLVLTWTVASASGLLDPRVLSQPWVVATTFVELLQDGRLQSNLMTSAQRALLGLGLGILVGGALGTLGGLSRIGEAVLDGPVQAKRAIPTLALIPLLILWTGIGEEMKVITIAIASSLQIYLHTHAGLRSIDARYVELAQTLRLTKWTFVRKVALPGALPGFLMGLRLAVTASWLTLTAVEQINATSGIGYMMSLARSYGQTEIIMVGLVVYGLFGLCSDTAVRMLERHALSWRRSMASTR